MSATRNITNAGLATLLLACTVGLNPAYAADNGSVTAPAQSPATKAASDVKVSKATKDLGGSADTPQNKHHVPVKPVTQKQAKLNADTAKAANSVPGVDVKASDLQPPADDPPIKGFHPIKKALAPVVRLEKNSVQLQQQIMKLEGPIGSLQPAMLGLHKEMGQVDEHMGNMQTQLGDMSTQVTTVNKQMGEVRSDIKGMRNQIGQLEVPIRQLQKPLHELMDPLNNVAGPLTEVQKELADMRALLATVLGAIVVAAAAIAIGTPLAAIYLYRNRKKFFPDMHDHDFPGATPTKEVIVEKPVDKTYSRV